MQEQEKKTCLFFFLKRRYLVQRARFLTKKIKQLLQKRNTALQRKAGGILHSFSR